MHWVLPQYWGRQLAGWLGEAAANIAPAHVTSSSWEYSIYIYMRFCPNPVVSIYYVMVVMHEDEVIHISQWSKLWLELHKGNVFGGQAPVANPLGINLRLQHGEGILCQPCADAMEPEIAATLTQDGLVILMHLQIDNTKKHGEIPLSNVSRKTIKSKSNWLINSK